MSKLWSLFGYPQWRIIIGMQKGIIILTTTPFGPYRFLVPQDFLGLAVEEFQAYEVRFRVEGFRVYCLGSGFRA